jgi:4-hydroxy-tetrahydrodipicolinate synthase
MVGPCHFLIPALALGAHGYIASGPELLGPWRARSFRLLRRAPSPELARVHYQLTAVYEMMMGTGTWPSALKAALNLLASPPACPREP